MKQFDCVVVGAGIVGLGAAWAAKKRGASVLVIEASPFARSASVRNFGMIWPIGQKSGERRSLAMKNRELWIELSRLAGFSFEECGSIHLAHHADELQVLDEFFELGQSESKRLDASQVQSRTASANTDGLLGGLWSPTECRVDPRQAIASIPQYLSNHGVEFVFDCSVTSIVGNELQSSNGRRWKANRIVVCSGAEFANLFPEEHRSAGLRLCQLQMFRTVSQPHGYRLGPHLASGLTLRHYESFGDCPSLSHVRQRIAHQMPELDRYGIHVMASQNVGGEIILGDSHLYDAEISPFRSEEIDQLMMRELRKVYRFPDWKIDQRWMGIYAKHPKDAWIHLEPTEHVQVINGLGGSGMSMGLAVADKIMDGCRTCNLA